MPAGASSSKRGPSGRKTSRSAPFGTTCTRAGSTPPSRYMRRTYSLGTQSSSIVVAHRRLPGDAGSSRTPRAGSARGGRRAARRRRAATGGAPRRSAGGRWRASRTSRSCDCRCTTRPARPSRRAVTARLMVARLVAVSWSPVQRSDDVGLAGRRGGLAGVDRARGRRPAPPPRARPRPAATTARSSAGRPASARVAARSGVGTRQRSTRAAQAGQQLGAAEGEGREVARAQAGGAGGAVAGRAVAGAAVPAHERAAGAEQPQVVRVDDRAHAARGRDVEHPGAEAGEVERRAGSPGGARRARRRARPSRAGASTCSRGVAGAGAVGVKTWTSRPRRASSAAIAGVPSPAVASRMRPLDAIRALIGTRSRDLDRAQSLGRGCR